MAPAATEGNSQASLVRELGLTQGSISYHLKRLDLGAIYVGRAPIVSTLGYSGVRVSELCDLKIGELRLHDPERARFLVADAKTKALSIGAVGPHNATPPRLGALQAPFSAVLFDR